MKFVSYNVQYGIGLDDRFDLPRIVSSIHGADIIALQEVTRNFHRNGHVDMVAELQVLLANHYSVFGPACDLDAGSAIENGRAVNRRFQFGNMIFSRWPILSTRTILLPRTRTLDKLNLQRGATEAVIATPKGPIRVYSVHLDHVHRDERIAQIRYLKDRARLYPVEGGAISGAHEFDLAEPPVPEDYVLMGDFNMVPESPEYCEMVGGVDALAGLGKRHAASYSWVDPKNHAERLFLDYCFLSHGLVERLTDAWGDETGYGSDHMPVWFELS